LAGINAWIRQCSWLQWPTSPDAEGGSQVPVALLTRSSAAKKDLAGNTLAHYVTKAAYLGEERFAVIVIERDGKTIVITGWRAWVIGAVAVVVMMVAFLLILIPAVAIVGLMAWVIQPRTR
jgi:hypothetical protein